MKVFLLFFVLSITQTFASDCKVFPDHKNYLFGGRNEVAFNSTISHSFLVNSVKPILNKKGYILTYVKDEATHILYSDISFHFEWGYLMESSIVKADKILWEHERSYSVIIRDIRDNRNRQEKKMARDLLQGLSLGLPECK